MGPEQHLLEGAKILLTYLGPLGFKFQLIEVGQSSGGHFAQGQFVCADRALYLHFRWSLGLVSYQVENLTLSHEDYVSLLNKQGLNKYPNFSDDPNDAFHCLKFDLENLLNDFAENNATIFRQRALSKIKELEELQILKSQENKKIYSGDKKILDQVKVEFKKGNYILVDKLKEQIKHPELLTKTEIKLFELNNSRKKNNS